MWWYYCVWKHPIFTHPIVSALGANNNTGMTQYNEISTGRQIKDQTVSSSEKAAELSRFWSLWWCLEHWLMFFFLLISTDFSDWSHILTPNSGCFGKRRFEIWNSLSCREQAALIPHNEKNTLRVLLWGTLGTFYTIMYLK